MPNEKDEDNPFEETDDPNDPNEVAVDRGETDDETIERLEEKYKDDE